MQIIPIYSCSCASNYKNNKVKSDSKIQSNNFKQTTNSLYGYKECLSFGMADLSHSTLKQLRRTTSGFENKVLGKVINLFASDIAQSDADTINRMLKIIKRIKESKNPDLKEKLVTALMEKDQDIFLKMIKRKDHPELAEAFFDLVEDSGKKAQTMFHSMKTSYHNTNYVSTFIDCFYENPALERKIATNLINWCPESQIAFHSASNQGCDTNFSLLYKKNNENAGLMLNDVSKAPPEVRKVFYGQNFAKMLQFRKHELAESALKDAAKLVPGQFIHWDFPTDIQNTKPFNDAAMIIARHKDLSHEATLAFLEKHDDGRFSEWINLIRDDAKNTKVEKN